MKFSYDKKNDALYIRFDKNRIVESDQITEDIIFDYDKKGRIIAMEFLDVSNRFAADIKKQFLKPTLPIKLELIKT